MSTIDAASPRAETSPCRLSPSRRQGSSAHRLSWVALWLVAQGCDSELSAPDSWPELSRELPACANQACQTLRQLCGTPLQDSDADTLCDEAEARLGTDPENPDTDGDKLSDAAEVLGSGDVDLPSYGADPLRKDIFVEIDYYRAMRPQRAALDAVVQAFADAPVLNPDGSTGIALHLFLDDEIAAEDEDPALNPVWPALDAIKDKYFDASLSRFFRYGLFAARHNGQSSSGCSRGVPGHDFVITLGGFEPAGGSLAVQQGTLMHELGHSLGLQHGGQDNVNHKPHYLSVMNYNYQLSGLTVDGVPGVLDFSRLEITGPDEQAIDERAGFTPVEGSATSRQDLSLYEVRRCDEKWLEGRASGALDFDQDQRISPSPVAADLDCDGTIDRVWQDSQNDWEALLFHGGGTIGDPILSSYGEQPIVWSSSIAPCARPQQN